MTVLWGYLIHLSYNMWADRPVEVRPEICYEPYLRCDDGLWIELTERMSARGVNALVIDLGDGVRWKSHPEIAVDGAWTTTRLRDELNRLRDLGIEPLPKLNFSTCHDAWMGPYARMVSTPEYYDVCSDLIEEATELFDGPRFFHLGMDEETAEHQRLFAYTVIRQYELWWEDLAFYFECCERANTRPWVWSDYVWHYPDMFYERMPPSTLQSNWYYEDNFSISERRNRQHHHRVRAYADLDAAGFDQVPTGSNHSNDVNFAATVDHCRRKLNADRLFGFLQAPWRVTLPNHRQHLLNAVDQVGEARAAFESR
ncbi:MAG: Tat pathway signal protein [Gemmatimonadetes bacterium]|jgi:hypothetical protein|nr:Tat pathway signal protein [Gemmatimonadota bacterium]MBT7860853.1 Tat pathway signal protein [Gemmatimonadota bacterium]